MGIARLRQVQERVAEPQSLIFATGNKHKLRELRELLPGSSWSRCRRASSCRPRTATLRRERARQGARGAPGDRRRPAIADDSGIGAVALGGRPGIHSARYGGEGASDEENLEKLLREVAAAGEDRGAAYVCALALVEADGSEHVFEARCEGRLIEEPRGEGGFGYDPAFVPDDDRPRATSARWPSSARRRRTRSATAAAPRGCWLAHLSAGDAAAPAGDDPHQERRGGALDRLERDR